MDLLDLVKGQMTPELISKAAGMVGESPEVTGKVMGALGPAMLSAMADKGSSEAGAGDLLGALSKGGISGDMLGGVMGMLGQGGGSSNALVTMGGPIVKMLLGDKAAGIFDMIAGLTGAKGGNVGTLASLAAPILGGVVAKQAAGAGGAAGLASMFASQKGGLASMLPAGLGSMMGMGNVAGAVAGMGKGGFEAGSAAVSGAANAAKGAVSGAGDMAKGAVSGATGMAKGAVGSAGNMAKGATTAVSGGMPKWLLPLLAALAVLALLFFVVLPAITGGAAGVAKGAVCTAINSANLTAGVPAISATTRVADVKTWFNAAKPKIESVIALARTAGLPVDAATTTLTAANTLISGLPGETLGANAAPVQTMINSLTTVTNSVKTTAGCS